MVNEKSGFEFWLGSIHCVLGARHLTLSVLLTNQMYSMYMGIKEFNALWHNLAVDWHPIKWGAKILLVTSLQRLGALTVWATGLTQYSQLWPQQTCRGTQFSVRNVESR